MAKVKAPAKKTTSAKAAPAATDLSGLSHDELLVHATAQASEITELKKLHAEQSELIAELSQVVESKVVNTAKGISHNGKTYLMISPKMQYKFQTLTYQEVKGNAELIEELIAAKLLVEA